jgi:hypothetical protein
MKEMRALFIVGSGYKISIMERVQTNGAKATVIVERRAIVNLQNAA